jgi:hypothetical protein
MPEPNSGRDPDHVSPGDQGVSLAQIGGVEAAVTSVFKRAKAILGRSEPEMSADVQKKKPAQAYHAVSIVPGRHACDGARELIGKTFLSREAPILPLMVCTLDHCECRYAHHDDRRLGPRRARELGVAIDGHDGEEQRSQETRGRRETDRKRR